MPDKVYVVVCTDGGIVDSIEAFSNEKDCRKAYLGYIADAMGEPHLTDNASEEEQDDLCDRYHEDSSEMDENVTWEAVDLKGINT